MYRYALRTIEALKDDFPLRDVRLVIHETEDGLSKPQKSGGGNSNVYTLGSDMELTPRHLSSIEELRREPWFFHPYHNNPSSPFGKEARDSSSGNPSGGSKEGAKTNFFKVGHLPAPAPSFPELDKEAFHSRSKYHRNKLMDAQMFGDSYFTWPYFDCRAYRQQEQQLLRTSRANYYYHRQISRRDSFFTHFEQQQQPLQKRAEELVRRGSNGVNSHYHHNFGKTSGESIDKTVNHTHTWLASYTAWFPIGGLKENKR